MKPYFITFGVGTPFAKQYLTIFAENENRAREVAQEAFGQRWSMIYDEAGFKGQPQAYGLRRLATLRENDQGYYRVSDGAAYA